MTEDNTKKPDKGLVAKLQSGRTSLILEGLQDVRESGTVSIIPYLFDVIATEKDESVVEETIKTIGDIKDKEAVQFIVESINRNDYGKYLSDVIAICWQSSLDFSPYMPVFAKIFISSDYQTSLEAFTVIEESVYNADPGKRNECLKMLDQDFHLISEEKKPLFHELRKMIKNSLNFTIDNQKNIS